MTVHKRKDFFAQDSSVLYKSGVLVLQGAEAKFARHPPKFALPKMIQNLQNDIKFIIDYNLQLTVSFYGGEN